MKIWNAAPLIRLIIPFLGGILTAVFLPCQISNFGLLAAPYFIFLAAVVLLPVWRIPYRRSWIFGTVLTILLFAFGYQLTIIKTTSYSPDHISRFKDVPVHVKVVIVQSPVEKERSVKAVIAITSVETPEGWIRSTGKVMVYIKKDTASVRLQYGDELELNAAFTDIPLPQNPGEFDYRRFLSYHNIFQQCYVPAGKWKITGPNTGNPILRCSFALRDHLLDVMKQEHITGDEFAVGAALMLGYCDKLDQDILSAYSGTGALHVLSVSGLHVAIVYIVFNWLLFFLDRIRYGNVLKAILLILLLWFYSALTGLSPSVLRAATMFSFMIIAKAFGRYTNIYNTLAASAFLLLLFDPYLIMDVGFQLSYIAVAGIVYLQPKIYSWFEPQSWILDQIWKITAVSVAAQLATFPISLYYFHQFPNYFLLSNFAVIPISTVIIYIGIALFAFMKWSFVSAWLAKLFSFFVWLLNASVKTIDHWPYALSEGIGISFPVALLLYLILIFLINFFLKKRTAYLFAALSGIMIFMLHLSVERKKQFSQNRIVVYNVPKSSAIDLIYGREDILIADSAFAADKKKQNLHLEPGRKEMGVTQSQTVFSDFVSSGLCIHRNIIQFSNKRIYLFNSMALLKAMRWRQPVSVDYLIISGDLKVSMAFLLCKFTPVEIIFDSSNSGYRIKEWKRECAAKSCRYYSVMDSGAFKAEI